MGWIETSAEATRPTPASVGATSVATRKDPSPRTESTRTPQVLHNRRRRASPAAHPAGWNRRGQCLGVRHGVFRLAPVQQPKGGRGSGRCDPCELPERCHESRPGHQQGRQPSRSPHGGPGRVGLAPSPARQRFESLVQPEIWWRQLEPEEDGYRRPRPAIPPESSKVPAWSEIFCALSGLVVVAEVVVLPIALNHPPALISFSKHIRP